MTLPCIVAGIDVGGQRKGFHAVALEKGRYRCGIADKDHASIARWCRQLGANVIAVDAPCRWSTDGRERPAEKELRSKKIGCFSTPTFATASAHPKNHFGWMLAGAELFRELETSHALYQGTPAPAALPACIETFPHAVACTLSGQVISAKGKAATRRALLGELGIDTFELSNIDMVDAALCAWAAHVFAAGDFQTYGEAKSGYIIVPSPLPR